MTNSYTACLQYAKRVVIMRTLLYFDQTRLIAIFMYDSFTETFYIAFKFCSTLSNKVRSLSDDFYLPIFQITVIIQ
jgi:hypothetical protein